MPPRPGSTPMQSPITTPISMKPMCWNVSSSASAAKNTSIMARSPRVAADHP
jgi:hypothetical protein